MNRRFSTLVASGAFLLFCSVSTAAFSDGMPFTKMTKPPEPMLTPLDKALNEIQTKTPPAAATEQPVNVKPDLLPPPAPESRTADILPNTSFFGLSVGMYDAFTHGKSATSFNAEWQPGIKLGNVLQPILGAMITTRGSMLGYGGLGIPLKLSDHTQLMPSLALGAYRKGSGFDLGQTLVVRAGTELSYVFEDKSRVGLNLHVLSNATSLGRNDRTEVFGIAYTMPLGNMPARPLEPTLVSAQK